MAEHGTDITLIQKATTEYARAQTDLDAVRSEGAALAEKAGAEK